jgi:ribonuclease D
VSHTVSRVNPRPHRAKRLRRQRPTPPCPTVSSTETRDTSEIHGHPGLRSTPAQRPAATQYPVGNGAIRRAHPRPLPFPPSAVYNHGMPRPPRAGFAPPSLIATTDALTALCDRLAAEEFVTVDTEFMRERTYWPELCVVQLAGAHEVAVVDAQAPDIDLTPLGNLLANQAVMKVFHAARQDIEIFVLRFGDVPRPLFDTQIAAMVAGFGEQVGYDALVDALTGGAIDKAHRFSDWSARPLSAQQITYAAADVTHLRDVYTRLRTRLEADGRLDWVSEEMADLAEPAKYRPDPEAVWERLRPRSNNRRFLGMVRALAAWREREAQRVNIPRQRLLRDETLLEIAATAPDSPDGLARARGISRGFAEGRTGTSLLAAIAEAKDIPEADLPAAPRARDGARPSPALVSLLKVLLAAKCEDHHVAPRLVASSDDIDRLAIEETPDIAALHGWRREVFGDDALALRQGRIALGVAGRRIRPIPAG